MKMGVWVLHGSQEWGGEGLGKAQNGSQECCGNGLGRPKMKHEKGVACFMVPKSGVGRAWKR